MTRTAAGPYAKSLSVRTRLDHERWLADAMLALRSRPAHPDLHAKRLACNVAPRQANQDRGTDLPAGCDRTDVEHAEIILSRPNQYRDFRGMPVERLAQIVHRWGELGRLQIRTRW
jgi:hypothetical protein